MEAISALGLKPICVIYDQRAKPRKNFQIPTLPSPKFSKPSTLETNPPNLRENLARNFHGSLVFLASAFSAKFASALTYEEALQQSVNTNPPADFDVGSVVDSILENPVLLAGGVAVIAVPVIVSQILGGKPKTFGVVSAKSAYAKLADDPSAQLLDIRSSKELREVGSPDIRGLRKKPVSIVYRGEDKPGFLEKLSLKFKEPENTSLYILDKFDGNSELVAELVTANGFNSAYAIKDGAEGPRGWLNSGLPWILPQKTFSLDLSALSEAFGGTLDGGAGALPVTLGLGAVTGLGLLAFTEVETLLQLFGSVALVQFFTKKLLFAEDRKQTLQQLDEFLNTQIAPKELVSDVKQIATALLPTSASTPALPAPAETVSEPSIADNNVLKAQASPEPLAETASQPTPVINSTPQNELKPGSHRRALSPYSAGFSPSILSSHIAPCSASFSVELSDWAQKMNDRKVIELEQGWEFMEKGITKLKRILEGLPEPPFNSEDYMGLYTTIYNMCTQKPPHDYSQQLYDNYKQAFIDYINSTVLPALREKHDEFMLRELVQRWSNHKVMVRWLSRFFHYLDRYFIARRSLPSLNEVGLTCFRNLVYQEISGKAKDAVIALIDVEREGGQIDRALLKNVLDIYVEIGMGQMDYYEKDFEAHMLEDTAAFYSRKASSWILEDSCPEYMLKSEECLKKEKDRVSHYLHSSSEQKLLEKVQNELLLVYENQLLEKENSGCRALLKDDKVEDLSRMYRLYSKVNKGLEPIGSIFKQHITDEGTALVQQAEDAAMSKAENAGGSHEQVFIRKVIELHDKFMAYVTDCFNSHTIFHKALKEAFEVFLNKGVAGSSSAELLATFCDNILKKGGSERLSDEAIEDSLEKVVKLLAYVSDKDLFAEFYRKKLSRRLLFDKSANDDHERSILTKLKQQCGGQFTSKMEGMVTDLTLARENQTSFEEYLAQNADVSPGLDLTVTVLTTGFWPSYKTSDLNLPSEMVRCVEVFKQFYQTKTKHRKLTWVYSLGSCNINGKFGSKTIELVVGTYQAAALMLFNTSDRLSYSEIASQLNLADEDLVRVLQSLSCAKYKILIKEPSSRTVSPTDTFSFNSSFTDRMRRIRIPLPPMDERKKVVEDVDKDRRYAIDASIVRIMKSRKVLGYQQLITECVEQLSRMFKPDFKAIKKRIEDLITRDYIERDKENPQLFRYLA